jgi:rhamnosyl/mannosyltransferase
MTIKVLHVNKLYWPWMGGIERIVKSLAEGLQRIESLDVRVLTCRSRGERKVERIEEVEVTRAASLGMLRSMPVAPNFHPELVRMSRRVDLVHFHMPFPLADLSVILGGMADVPMVASYHCDIIRQRIWKHFYVPVGHAFLRRVRRVLVSSPNMVWNSPILRRYARKCNVIPYGIDVSYWSGASGSPPEVPSPRHSSPFVLFVGRLIYYKGVETLLHAMAKVDADLVLAGDGPMRRGLEALSKALGISPRVRFLGSIPDDTLRHYYRECRVLALPSVSAAEAFGMVQLEAMANGKPVVNTNLPTSVPFVARHNESALTVPPGDAEAMGAAIRNLLQDASLYARLSCEARDVVRREFALETMIRRTAELYKDVLNEARSAPAVVSSPDARKAGDQGSGQERQV